MTKWESTYLHAPVNDFPFELLAVLSGEISCTIGSTKGGGSQTKDQVGMTRGTRTLPLLSSVEQNYSWVDLDRSRRSDIQRTFQVQST